MSGDVQITTKGLTEFRNALRDVDAKLPNKLRGKLLAIAGSIAQDVRGKVPRRSGRAAGSVKAKATQKSASIAWGGESAPYFPWLDFGGSTGRGHVRGSGGSGAIKRTFLKEGRYIYPTITEHKQDTARRLDEAIEELAKAAGFETTGGL